MIKVIKPDAPISFRFTEGQLQAAPLHPGVYSYKILAYQTEQMPGGLEQVSVITEMEGRRVTTTFFADRQRYKTDMRFHDNLLRSIDGMKDEQFCQLRKHPPHNLSSTFIGRTGKAEIMRRGRRGLNFVRFWMPNAYYWDANKDFYLSISVYNKRGDILPNYYQQSTRHCVR